MLESIKRQELMDFLDFLLNKQKERKENFKNYKKQLLQVSIWSEKEISEMKSEGKK